VIEGIVECLYDLSQAGYCTDGPKVINANKGERQRFQLILFIGENVNEYEEGTRMKGFDSLVSAAPPHLAS